MYSLKTVFVLTLVAFASASPRSELPEETDADLFRKFIECARIAIVTGIPEIGVPSHDPLIISHDVHYEFDAPSILTGFFTIDNMVMEDIPNWEVRQFDELSADEFGTDIFNYTIYWRDMVFKAKYEYSLNILGQQFDNAGEISFELDHLSFFGLFNFTKSSPTRSETINDLDLHISTEEIQFDITSVPEDITDIIHEMGIELVPMINSFDFTEVSEALRTKLLVDWIEQPERLEAIIANCQK